MNASVGQSLYILRETKVLYKKPAILWSGGKDSTAILALSREAFFGTVPFPAIHIDNGIDFPETYRLRDQLRQEWGIDMKVAHSIIVEDPVSGVSCCGQNKTDAIRKVLKEEGYDALIVGIRRDEHGVRAKERVFSPRDDRWQWNWKEQPVEAWGYAPKEEADHYRVHPILDWTEKDVWEYTDERAIPVNPLYFSSNGQRFRSLGCTRCTISVPSQAATIKEILTELSTSQTEERTGRAQDKETEAVMERLRILGYM